MREVIHAKDKDKDKDKDSTESQDLSAWEASVLSSLKNNQNGQDGALTPKTVYFIIAGFLSKNGYSVPVMGDLKKTDWFTLKEIGKKLTDDQIVMVYGHIIKGAIPKHGWFSFEVLKHVNKFLEGLE